MFLVSSFPIPKGPWSTIGRNHIKCLPKVQKKLDLPHFTCLENQLSHQVILSEKAPYQILVLHSTVLLVHALLKDTNVLALHQVMFKKS